MFINLKNNEINIQYAPDADAAVTDLEGLLDAILVRSGEHLTIMLNGIEHALCDGAYLGCIGFDDQDTIELLHNAIAKNNADISRDEKEPGDINKTLVALEIVKLNKQVAELKEEIKQLKSE